MILLSFRIRRDGGIGQLTRDRPGTSLHIWCNLENDFVQVVSGSERETERTLKEIERRFGPQVTQPFTGPRTLSAALIPCPAARPQSVTAIVERHRGLVQPPIISAQGWDEFRVLLFDDEAAGPLLEAVRGVGEVQLVAKKPVKHVESRGFFVSSNELLDGLTRRQVEAVVEAAKRGYYEDPRATTLGNVAKDLGLGRTSLEEHLRKAENKILTTLVPFLSVRAANMDPSRPRGRPFAGNNRHVVQEPAPPRRRRAKH